MSKSLGKGTLSGGIISLNVGTPATPFDVHLELLCDSCPYFDELFHDRFDRVPPASVNLPDDNPDAFTEFFNWIYYGTIFQDTLNPFLMQLFQLWVLANKFKVPELQNLVVTRCKKRIDVKKHGRMSTDTINYVYDNTLPDSPLRRMSVAIFVDSMEKFRFSDFKKELPRAFLEELCESLLERKAVVDSSVSLSDFEALYFTSPAAPPTTSRRRISPRWEGLLDIVRPATQLEMEQRKIRRPVSRQRHARATSSTGIATPSATSTDTERESKISQELENLKV